MDFAKVLKLIGINLAIFMAYVVIILGMVCWGTKEETQLVYMIFMMIAMALHCLVCFGMAVYYFIVGKNEQGVGFILSILIVGIIGFSACMGGVYLEPGGF